MACVQDSSSIALSVGSGVLQATAKVSSPLPTAAPNPLAIASDGLLVAGGDGWISLPATLAYSSGSGSPTVVVTVSVDLTAWLSVGAKIRLTDSATVRYFTIIEISSSQMTLHGGSDYTLSGGAITAPSFSVAENPAGMPQRTELCFFDWLCAGSPALPPVISLPTWGNDVRFAIEGQKSGSSGGQLLGFQFNGDTGTHYDDELLSWSGTAATAANVLSQTACVPGLIPDHTGPNDAAGAMVMLWLNNYRQNTRWKNAMSIDSDRYATGATFGAGVMTQHTWRQTAAVTTITFLLIGGGLLDVGSRVRGYVAR